MQLLMGKKLIGSSPEMDQVRSISMKVAAVDSIVLILGESGTGKDVTARYIHALSERRDEPFVAVNCGAIPSELLASELFGHERGAFTGAVTRTKGCFERAGNGTLFLDEIGEMSMEMQVKLLRVLQERQYERLGNQGQSLPVRARLIAATNQNLWQNVQNRRFRSDLFYRLHVLPIHMPPLRDRLADIDELIEHACTIFSKRGMSPPKLSDEARQMLRHHDWPGNVRQLFNVIERLCILHSGGDVHVEDLPEQVRTGRAAAEAITPERPIFTSGSPQFLNGFDMKAYLEGVENNLILAALEESDGVIARAARLLGIRRTTLTEKINRRPEIANAVRRIEKQTEADNTQSCADASYDKAF